MIHWILQYTLRKLSVNNFNEVLKLDILTFLLSLFTFSFQTGRPRGAFLSFLYFYLKPGGLAGRSSHFLHFYPKPGGLAGRSSVRDHHTITLLF